MVTLYDIDALQKRNAELEAENERMRKALEAVEWIDGECAWCGNPRYNNSNGDAISHAPDCPRQLALGLTEVEK